MEKLKFNKEEINKIVDLKVSSRFITNQESKNFFLEEPGKEHYKLLAYISSKYNNIEISDIGTFRGCSALALSYNLTNKVISYDVANLLALQNINELKNIEFRYLKGYEFNANIIRSNIIFLDTLHDGILEEKILLYLLNHNWKGLLVLDDIHLNEPMESFWNGINIEKQDVTEFGHWSGTGLVYFK